MQQKYNCLNGSANVNTGAASAAVIAAQGAGTVIRLTSGVIAVTVAATGGSGRITLKDGTTVIQSWDANSISNYQFNYGENLGYPLSANSALNLVAEGAVTNQATAYCSVVGYLVK